MRFGKTPKWVLTLRKGGIVREVSSIRDSIFLAKLSLGKDVWIRPCQRRKILHPRTLGCGQWTLVLEATWEWKNIPLPKDFVLYHKYGRLNKSNQHFLEANRRDARENLRVYGYIAHIRLSKFLRNIWGVELSQPRNRNTGLTSQGYRMLSQ